MLWVDVVLCNTTAHIFVCDAAPQTVRPEVGEKVEGA